MEKRKPCPACGGDRGFEVPTYTMCHITGTPHTKWVECDYCGGSGDDRGFEREWRRRSMQYFATGRQ